jgi:hypothetical protein
MLEQLWMLRGNTQLIACGLLFALSLYRGAAPERWLSGALLAMPLLDLVYHAIWGPPGPYDAIDIGHVVLDAALFAVVVAVALRANRVYPLWLGGVQIIALVAHFTRAALIKSAPLAYAIMNRVPFYIQITAIALGLACHWMRRRRLGRSYPSWSS